MSQSALPAADSARRGGLADLDTDNEPRWPPESPLAALKSTPSGRDRIRRFAAQGSPSPSPSKHSRRPASTGSHYALATEMEVDGDGEDEEMLQLKLEEIQARMRLKRLQKSRGEAVEDTPALPRPTTAPSREGNRSPTRGAPNIAGLREERLDRARSQTEVHVPVSPIRKAQAPDPTQSPSRVLMGIDKGLKASEVSLRRAPSARKNTEEQMGNVKRAGSFLHTRANSQPTSQDPFAAAPPLAPAQRRPVTSFSERMAKIRDEEAERREKDERIKKARSTAFDVNPQEMEQMKSSAVSLPDTKPQEPEFSRDDILKSVQRPGSGLLARSRSTNNMSSAKNANDTASSSFAASDSQASSQLRSKSPASSFSAPSSSQNGVEFESFSSLHLSKRIIPHNNLTRMLAGKKTLTLPDLLRGVKAPEFRLPDWEEDVVALAIVASKSEPKTQKNGANAGQKFMILTICDLKWELDLFLFGSGFSKYWKLDTGTVVAILNPSIMKPLKLDTGRFSLVINSSGDTILEIGSARDLGYCKTLKKDGEQCNSWIDKRHTEYCEFHVNEALKKTKSGRMEVNTMDFGPRDGAGLYSESRSRKWKPKSRDVTGLERRNAMHRESLIRKQQGITFSFEAQSDVFSHKGTGHYDGEIAETVEKKERTRKRLAEREREKDLTRKLASAGNGLGADYMKVRSGEQPQLGGEGKQASREPEPLPDAKALGLLKGKAASEMQLGPVKRKRATTAVASGGGGGNGDGMGWGGKLTKELGRLKEGERLQPVKKKTRFITEKGIREAGRESIGGKEVNRVVQDDDDDDDDLDIIK